MRLFFALGAARSGTTLLTRLVSAHPALHLHHERRVVELAQRAAVLLEGQGADVVAGRGHALAVLRAGAPPEALWVGDKYPPYAGQLPALRRLFPNARLLHLVRDPRGVVASWLHTWARSYPWRRGLTPPSVAEIAENWRRTVELAEAGCAALGPKEALTLRYEHLLAAPQATGQRLLAWFGVDPHPAFTAALEQAALRGDWRRDLSEAEVAAVEQAPGVRALMDRWGMACVGQDEPPPDTVERWLERANGAASSAEARRAWLRVLRLQPGHAVASAGLVRAGGPEALFGLMHADAGGTTPTEAAAMRALLEARGLNPAAAAAVLP